MQPLRVRVESGQGLGLSPPREDGQDRSWPHFASWRCLTKPRVPWPSLLLLEGPGLHDPNRLREE